MYTWLHEDRLVYQTVSIDFHLKLECFNGD